MRAIAMLLFLLLAGTCYADEPLETLNTVEDTLTTMEKTLDAQAWDDGDDGVASSLDGVDAASEGHALESELSLYPANCAPSTEASGTGGHPENLSAVEE